FFERLDLEGLANDRASVAIRHAPGYDSAGQDFNVDSLDRLALAEPEVFAGSLISRFLSLPGNGGRIQLDPAIACCQAFQSILTVCVRDAHGARLGSEEAAAQCNHLDTGHRLSIKCYYT